MRTLFALLIIALLASCTKFGKNVTLKGRVLNPVTGEGIPGAEVKLLKIAGGYDSNYKTIKSATTDATGNFELDKYTWTKPVARCEVGELYKLGWTKDGGQTFIDNFELEVKKGKVTNADFYAVPYGNLQININNTACFDSNDELKIIRTHSIAGFYDNVPNPAVYIGCVNQTGNMNKAPMGWYKYSGTVTKNGIAIPKKDSTYLSEGETKVWDISY
jgi:hypothetical protein